MASLRRKNLIASRRRMDDEGEEEGGPDTAELDDDSLSEGSVISDDEDAADGSEGSHVNPHSPESSDLRQNGTNGTNGHVGPINGDARSPGKAFTSGPESEHSHTREIGISDTDMMLNGLHISDPNGAVDEMHYDDLQRKQPSITAVESPSVVKSSARMDQPHETPLERRRREHEEYKSKRDADPAFVPNRGAFFMHDHRHAGPAANGFRPFGRGRGRGRAGIGGPFAPVNPIQQGSQPTDSPWTHDMHEAVLEPEAAEKQHSNAYGTGSGSTKALSQAPRGPPLNRSLSTTRLIGNVQIRVFLYAMKESIKLPATAVTQYTCLPDHRPPLRRDKPVRISLPDHSPRYIFPAVERSFIFIPRAMRPNQQGFGSRSRARAGLGSISGYSRRTSIYGGSIYGNGSAYSPSVAMSRRSSLAYEVPRDNPISPTGSTMSRAAVQADASKPVVRLPPAGHVQPPKGTQVTISMEQEQVNLAEYPSIEDLPLPQTYPLPQKPTFRENRPTTIPMHQPRPQKAVSVADIESPASLSFNPTQQYQQPFHQQMPSQISGNGYSHDPNFHPHSRNASYPSQASTGTPLSQIPERAIHAQPFQPHPYQSQQGFYAQQYHQLMPTQQGYYYSPQQYSAPMVPSAPAFVSAVATPQQTNFAQTQQQDTTASQQNGQPSLVAQEVNGMVYYYDASQIPAVATFPAYPAPQPYAMQQVNLGGMMTPSPDAFYYSQAPQGVVYYPQ